MPSGAPIVLWTYSFREHASALGRIGGKEEALQQAGIVRALLAACLPPMEHTEASTAIPELSTQWNLVDARERQLTCAPRFASISGASHRTPSIW